MSYKILSLLVKQEWKDYLNKLPIKQQDIYYSPEYYSLYENFGDGKAQCFVLEKDGEIALYPYLINSINNLGYNLEQEYFDIQGSYGYNGVVSSSYSPEFIDAFYQAFNEFCSSNNIVAEFTRFHPIIQNVNFSNRHLKTYFDRNTVIIDTSKPLESLWADLQKTTKKQIKRAYDRHNIKVKILTGNQFELDTFVNIYGESLKRVESSKYLYFNENYFEQLLRMPQTIQLVAYIDDKPISTITVLLGQNMLHGHLGGTLDEFITFSPFSLLYWEMIKIAKEHNLQFLHVGGGATPDKEDKLLLYKEHFSDLKGDFNIGKQVHNEIIYDRIIQQWKENHHHSYRLHSNKLLGYREI